ncbi:MAG: hypothetical protein KF721_05950 [Ignavibacteriaceae bacterium]|nr:hypothetical protein [Ignavibacteriaceae bacterium]HRI45873.1 hypothetical protein [Ignavibacteriaceae bacterium]
MNRLDAKVFLAIIAAIFFLLSDVISAQNESSNYIVKFESKNLSGPRLGFSYIPGNGELVTKLKEKNFGVVLSQFGWHFEYQIVPETEGPCFVIEVIPLLAGVEYSQILPTITLGFGIRFPNGIEFGMGPNIMATGDKAVSALMLTMGKNFNYGGVSIPLNLAVTTNPKGYRVSFIFGYAIEKSKQK